MPQPQGFVPDGFIPDAPPPKVEPRMGPPTGREPDLTVREFVNQPTGGVTLGEIMENPAEGFAKMGAILKRDLTDPKTWLAAAAAYFGPKVLPKVVPAVRSALSATVKGGIKATAAVGDMVSPDIVGMVSPRAGRAVEVAQRMRAALPERPPASAPAAPAAPAGPELPPPPTPGAAPSVQTRGASPQQLLNEEALARRRAVYAATPGAPAPEAAPQAPAPKAAAVKPTEMKVQDMTASEKVEYVRLRKSGKTIAEAKTLVAVARALSPQTDAQMTASVAHRNTTGRW